MRKLVPSLCAVLLLALSFAPSPASAMGSFPQANPNPGNGSSGPKSVPELSIGAAGGAILILAGATAVALGRRRRAKDPSKAE